MPWFTLGSEFLSHTHWGLGHSVLQVASRPLAQWSCGNREAKDRVREAWWASESHPHLGSAEGENMTAGERPIRCSLKNLCFFTEYTGRLRRLRRLGILQRFPLKSLVIN